jgi:hypothetical protein
MLNDPDHADNEVDLAPVTKNDPLQSRQNVSQKSKSGAKIQATNQFQKFDSFVIHMLPLAPRVPRVPRYIRCLHVVCLQMKLLSSTKKPHLFFAVTTHILQSVEIHINQLGFPFVFIVCTFDVG